MLSLTETIHCLVYGYYTRFRIWGIDHRPAELIAVLETTGYFTLIW